RDAVADRLEQVAVGHQADALVPGVVLRLEVLVDVVAGRQRLRGGLEEQALDEPRAAAAELEERGGDEDVLPARDGVRGLARQHAAQEVRDWVLAGERDDV